MYKRARQTAFWLTLANLSATPALAAQQSEELDLFSLPLSELVNIQVTGTGSLTATQWRHRPASVTHIAHQDIERSGARSLDELLEMYVPGFQTWTKTNGNPVGLRGIISDRNTKMLLLVNGRLMNEHTSLGMLSERYLSMLSDIRCIDVIRGPGSAIYGPGAIAGVISIKTFNGETFNGQDVSVRAGVNEEFYSAEIRAGTKLDNGAAFYLYYGIDDAPGADGDDAEMQFSAPFTNNVTGDQVEAYEPVPFAVPDYRSAHRDLPRHKLHLDYRQGDLATWARYTKGGISRDLSRSSYISTDPADLLDESYGYQQATVTLDYTPTLSPTLSLDSRLSYDALDVEYGTRNYREDEIMGRLLANWQPNAAHSLSGGAEYTMEYFGKKSIGYPGGDAFISNSLTDLGNGEWNADMISLLADYQWQASEQWTVFAGLRSDRHRYTDWMQSPRIALVYTPKIEDQFKLLLNRSVRRADDDNLREYYLTSGRRDGRTETLNAVEWVWEHQWAQAHRSVVSLFYNDYDLVGWDSSELQINPLGTLKTAGVELEAHWRWAQDELSVLYTYVGEQDFTLAEPDTIQFISASPYGYGSDLANWAQHSLKLIYNHQFNAHWDGFTSLSYFTGLEGSEAMADYNLEEHNNGLSSLPRTDGQGTAYEDRAYWTLGVRFTQNALTASLHGYNLLGLVDDDWNRRNAFGRSDQYRLEPPALAARVKYTF